MKKLLFLLLFAAFWLEAFPQLRPEEEQAYKLSQDGDWLKASALYGKLFEDGRHPEYYDAYMEALLQARLFDRARVVLDLMLKGKPESPVYRVDRGRLSQLKGDKATADALFMKLIEDMPKDKFAIRDLAIAFYRARAYDYTAKTFLAGRKLLKDEQAFAFDLISLYQFQKNKPSLITEYLNLIEGSRDTELVKRAQTTFAAVFDTPGDYAALESALRQMQPGPLRSELLLWVLIQRKDFSAAIQHSIAFDKKLKGDGGEILTVCAVLISHGEYKLAREGLEYVLGKGKAHPHYAEAEMRLLYCDFQILLADGASPEALHALERRYIAALQQPSVPGPPVEAIKQLADLQSLYLNKASAAVSLLTKTLEMPDVPASLRAGLKLQLGDIYLRMDDLWEAGLVYGQVEKEFSGLEAAQDAIYRKARLSYYLGDFVWARALLELLKSATSQLIANDVLNLNLLIIENSATPGDSAALCFYARADLLRFKGLDEQALRTLDSIETLLPGTSLSDDILMSKAKIYLKKKDHQQAVSSLTAIATRFSGDIWADDALFTLGELYEKELGNKDKAQEYYHRIIVAYPRSPYIEEARLRYRNLRGDGLG